MNHSYGYTKKFIEDQVDILNKPFVITPGVKNILSSLQDENSLTEDQLQLVFNRINNDIKQRNERLFPSQINNQIILQIMKLETQKLKIVNQQLFKVNSFVQPIILPDFENLSHQDQNSKLVELNDLIQELPELKYLFVNSDDVKYTNVEEEYEIAEDENKVVDLDDDNIIQDDEDKVVSSKQAQKEFIEGIIDEVNELIDIPEQELIDKYDKLRSDLIEISKRLKYKNDKLNYLKNLKQDIGQLFVLNQLPEKEVVSNEIYDSDEEVMMNETTDIRELQNNILLNESAAQTSNTMASELNRFKTLVEQISYKVNSKGITGAELREKLQDLNNN